MRTLKYLTFISTDHLDQTVRSENNFLNAGHLRCFEFGAGSGGVSHIFDLRHLSAQSKTNNRNLEDDIQPRLIEGKTLPQERRKKESILFISCFSQSFTVSVFLIQGFQPLKFPEPSCSNTRNPDFNNKKYILSELQHFYHKILTHTLNLCKELHEIFLVWTQANQQISIILIWLRWSSSLPGIQIPHGTTLIIVSRDI